jgi:hypothetical protein
LEAVQMGIVEELKTLDDLHTNGKLSDAEFSAAKTSALKTEPAPAAKTRRSWAVVPIFIALLVIFLLFVWYSNGSKRTGQMLATAVHAPINLRSEVENVPAASWKGIPFNTPYEGTVAITVHIVRGNPMDVLVVAPNQLDDLKSDNWGKVLAYTDFNAQKTQVYQRSARLTQGSYYLVLRDTSLGILSSSASDVSINIELKP